MDYALSKMSPIHICLWSGYVFGSGAGMCMRAPFTIACDNTEWSMPESKAGFIVDNGGTKYFTDLKGDISLGLYLGITGHRIVGGKELLKWGIASHYVS